MCGKQRTVSRILNKHEDLKPEVIKGKLVAYTSKESNSSVEKASLLASVPMRLLHTDNNYSLRGDVLRDAINKDKANGSIPCCVVASLGTTGTCGFDNLEEIGKICEEENMWLHVDAAYAGAAFVCPEYRHYMKGNQYLHIIFVSSYIDLKQNTLLLLIYTLKFFNKLQRRLTKLMSTI